MSGGLAFVAGGGIGGLAAALGLGRAGWRVTVLEQAPVFWEAGAGLLVTPNGERALGMLQVADAVLEAGHRVRIGGVRGADGGWLVRLPEGADAHAGIGIHRRSLHGALLDAAGAVATIATGARVTGLEVGSAHGRQATLTWVDAEDKHLARPDLVVVAEGAGSTLRPFVAQGAVTAASGYSSWRSVVVDARLIGEEASTWWGPDGEFAAQRIGPDRVSWQATFRHESGVGFADDLAAARERFARWPEPVPSLVRATSGHEIVRHDLVEVRDVDTFVAGRAVLLGDAAHAMVPQLHQGANQALEDAVTLGAALVHGDVARGLVDYDTVRRPRTQMIAERSRRVANRGAAGRQSAGWLSPWNTRAAREVFGWRP